MDNISSKKVLVSYLLTSFIIFLVSATMSMIGLFGHDGTTVTGSMSTELMIILQLSIVLAVNAVLHGIFYYGGLNSSPIAKGIGIGVMLATIYFLVSMFALNIYDINSDSASTLVSAMGGRLIEYCSGGLVTAIISVTDIHKWGLLRAF